MMTVLTLLSILLVAAYVVAAAWVRGELPGSISALVYALPAGRWRWLWSAWLALVTLLMAPALTAAMSATWWTSLLADALVVCLAMTAALPLLPGYHNRWHCALGILSGVLSQACVAVACPWWLLLWLLMAAVAIDAWLVHPGTARWYDHKGVLLAEVICAASIIGAVLTDLSLS